MKKIFSLILLAALILSLGVFAHADDSGVYFGATTQLEIGKYYKVDSAGTITDDGSETDFNLFYSDGVLKINQLNTSSYAVSGHVFSYEGSYAASAAIYSSHSLLISVSGTNEIVEKDGTDASFGIYVDGNLTVNGSGAGRGTDKLFATCSSTAGKIGCGIVSEGNISVSGVELRGRTSGGSFTDISCGIGADGAFGVTDAEVKGEDISSSSSISYGICSAGAFSASQSDITASSTCLATSASCGFYSDSSVTLSSSTLACESDTTSAVSASSCGLMAASVNLSGSTSSITAAADDTATLSVGVYAPVVTLSTRGARIYSSCDNAFSSVPVAGASTESGYTLVLKAEPSPAVPTSASKDASKEICVDSAPATVVAFGKPTAVPDVEGVAPDTEGGIGKITGLTATKSYLYKEESAADWTPVTGVTEIPLSDATGETGKFYQVRYTADDTQFLLAPDNYASVYVPEYNKPLTLTLKIEDKYKDGIPVGSTAKITATCSNPSAKITWSSDDTAHATVDANGNVTGVAETNMVRIRATAGNSKSEYISVKVIKKISATELVIKPAVTSVKTKDKFNLTAEVTPVTATDRVYWSSSDPDILEIEETRDNGRTAVIKPHKNGEATISATISGLNPRTRSITVSIPSDTKYKFTYRENSGSWYYDYSNTYTVKTNAPAGYIDKISVTNRINNLEYVAIPGQDYTETSDENGYSIVKFSKAFMQTLPRSTYQTMTIRYKDGGKASAYLHILSIYDKPVTGDTNYAPFWGMLAVSALGLAVIRTMNRTKRRRRD